MMERLRDIILIIFLFSLGTFIVVSFLPNSSSDYSNSGKLIINEIMASNMYTYQDDNGDYSDWIEIYNGYDYDIDLSGYHLSDEEFETDLWEFPAITIKANSYLIVFASDKDRCKDNVCHTNFKLSSDGEIVVLSDDKNNVISKVSYEKMENDISYGFDGKRYVYYYKGTPNGKNTGDYSKESIALKSEKIPIYINEYMTNNTRSIIDQDGDYSSYIEIYNYGDKDVDLSGYYITDNEEKLDKYKFPSVIVGAKDYLIVFLSDKDKCEDECHTNFKLGNSDKVLIISNSNGDIVDKVELVTLKDNVSYGKNNDGWCYYPYSTPGYENNTKCFDSLN